MRAIFLIISRNFELWFEILNNILIIHYKHRSALRAAPVSKTTERIAFEVAAPASETTERTRGDAAVRTAAPVSETKERPASEGATSSSETTKRTASEGLSLRRGYAAREA